MMKKLLLITIVALMSIATFAQSKSIALQSNGAKQSCTKESFTGFNAVFSFDKIDAIAVDTEKGAFSALVIAGAYQGGELGTPELPVFKKMIAVPVDATPVVVVKNYTATEYRLSDYDINTVFPAQADVRKDVEPEDVTFAFDAKAYSSAAYNRSTMAEVEILGTMRGIVLGMLHVNPVQYNPVNGTIMVYNDIEVEVVFENANYEKTQELYRNTYSPYFAELYKIVFNSKDMYDDHPDLYNTPVRMLVIANRMFEETLQPWLEWKTEKGFYMDVNYTDVIGTTSAAIKTFCHNKYNEGTTNGTAPTFIVFVGDTPQVPASQTGSQSAKATDLYYAKVNTGTYWFPDMYYSRMSAQTTQQLANQIEKILYYEKYQFADPSYLDDVLLIAGADGTWAPRVGRPQINYANTYYYNEAHGYVNIHKYVTSSYTGCYAHLNNVGFANYTAHCSETSWGDPSLTYSQINSITNPNRYFVAMGNCCLAADFGYTGNGGICFGEGMMNAQQKGAVGYIGSSPSSYWGGDFHFSVGAYAGSIETVTNPTIENTKDGCYDLAFRDADFNCLSSYIYGGNLSVTYAYVNYGGTNTTHVSPNYYWEAYNVLGDASLMPFNTQASSDNVDNISLIPVYIGVPLYEVNNLVPGSYVAVSKDGVLLGTALADESGVAIVPLDPPIASGGDVTVVVTRNQHIPFIGSVPAIAQSGSYVTATTTMTSGNVPYCDATISFDVLLKNVGIETANDIQVNITTGSNDVTIINGTTTLANLNAGAEETMSQAFSAKINNYLVDGTTILFNISGVSDNNTFEQTVKVIVLAPELKVSDIIVSRVAGTGAIAPGDEVNIEFDVVNLGHAAITDVFSTVFSFFSGFELLENEQTIAQIEAGESEHITFSGQVGNSVENGSLIPIHFYAFKGSYASEEIGYVVVGSSMEDFETGDFTKFPWVQGANPWEITNSNVHQGTYSARSKTGLGHDQISQLKMTTYVPAASNVTYARRVSSENNYDWFNFYIDSEQKDHVSGSGSWENKSYPVTAGTHTFTFEYSKDYSLSSGSDCAWIDNITIPGMAALLPEDLPQISVLDHSVEGLVGGILGNEATIIFDLKNIGIVNAAGVIAELTCNYPVIIEAENSGTNQELPFSMSAAEEKTVSFDITCVDSGKSVVNYMEFVLKIELDGSGVVAYYPIVLMSDCGMPLFCEAPTNFVGTDNHDVAVLTWDEPENIDGTLLGYNVYRDGVRLNASPLAELGYNDEGLEDGAYNYQVAAVYEHCNEARTEILGVIINILSINELNNTVTIYPNPTSGAITIESANFAKVEIYNTLGQLVETKTVNTFNVSNYSSGVYFFKVFDANNNSVVKRAMVIK